MRESRGFGAEYLPGNLMQVLKIEDNWSRAFWGLSIISEFLYHEHHSVMSKKAVSSTFLSMKLGSEVNPDYRVKEIFIV